MDLRLQLADRSARAVEAPAGRAARLAGDRREHRSRGVRTGRTTSAAVPTTSKLDPNLRDGVEEQVKAEFESVFMMYLPRICEHCLNPSCVASCPSGAMYKREEDGHRPRRPGVPRLAHVRQRLPVQEGLLNWQTGKAEKCTSATRASRPACRRSARDLRRRIRYLGIVPLRRRPRPGSGVDAGREGTCSTAALDVFDPHDPGGPRAGPPRRHPGGLARGRQRSPVWKLRWTGASRCRCIPSTGRCRWSGTSRRSRR